MYFSMYITRDCIYTSAADVGYVRFSLQRRHNDCDGLSNHMHLDGCLILCWGANQRTHQSSASLAFLRGIHRWPVEDFLSFWCLCVNVLYTVLYETSSCWQDIMFVFQQVIYFIRHSFLSHLSYGVVLYMIYIYVCVYMCYFLYLYFIL